MNRFGQADSVLNMDPSDKLRSITEQATNGEVFSILEKEPRTSSEFTVMYFKIFHSTYLPIFGL